jgi:hypothetical protein
VEHGEPEVFLFLIVGLFYAGWRSPRKAIMKQSKLDSMCVDDLYVLHERIAATLAAKITAEKKNLIDQLKQADTTLH